MMARDPGLGGGRRPTSPRAPAPPPHWTPPSRTTAPRLPRPAATSPSGSPTCATSSAASSRACVGEPEPGRPGPDRAVGAGGRGPRAGRHRRPRRRPIVVALVTEAGGPTSHTAIIARQLGIPCVVAVAGRATASPPAPACWSTARPGEVALDPDAGRRRRSWSPRRARRAEALAPAGPGPGRTADGTAVKLLANVADGAVRASAAGAGPVEGVGLFRTELCFLNRKDEPSVEEQAEIYAERARAVRRGPLRRGPHPRRRLRQADRLRRPTRARRTRPSASAGCGCRSATRACWTRQLEGIAAAAARTGTETWVMAPMVATVAEAAEFAAPGARARPQGRRDGRDPERRAARPPDARGRRLPSIGTNDLDPVHDGRRPDGHRPRAPHRRVAAGRAAADRDHRRGRQAGRQAGRRLRRGRGRPAAGAASWSAWA